MALSLISCQKEYTCECTELKDGENRTFTEGSFKTDRASAEKECFDIESQYLENDPDAAYECAPKEK